MTRRRLPAAERCRRRMLIDHAECDEMKMELINGWHRSRTNTVVVAVIFSFFLIFRRSMKMKHDAGRIEEMV